MIAVTPLHVSTRREKDISRTLADYLAVERIRILRRLLVIRFGLLVLAALGVAFVVPGLSAYARWLPVALFLVPPLWAWAAELRLELRLFRTLREVDNQTGVKRS
jgi:hypothetical protein